MLQSLTDADLQTKAFPFMRSKAIEIAGVQVKPTV